MKKFRELTEAKDTIVFAFGRFNPPTTGHEKLIQKTASVAGSNPYRIFPSHTQNPKRDPLPQALKTAYMRKMFKKYAKNIVVSKSRNAIEIAVELYDQGYKNLVMVAGSDRVKVFDAMLNNYNGVEGKGHGYYKFDSIKIVSAGERDPDAEGVEGMSASKMRQAASNGDYDSFITGIPATLSDADKKKLYRDVRKYMGIREEKDMGDMTDFENIRDAYLTGKIWNVGTIVEANGLMGEVVRKGTNYLSFMSEDNKVHKVWLHEIELGEDAILNLEIKIEKLEKKKKLTPKESTLLTTMKAKLHKLRNEELDEAPAKIKGKVYKPGDKPPPGGWPKITFGTKRMPKKKKDKKEESELDEIRITNNSSVKDIKSQIKYHEKMRDFYSNAKAKKEQNKDIKLLKDLLAKKESLDERNYASEYANYQGKPEQIARRSSRNKARRVMGDKTKIGMDVGHKDNNPMNNDPKNLRNENPSKNRREPRLRSEEETLDEMSWYIKFSNWINTHAHKKGFDKLAREYVNLMKSDKKYRDMPTRAISAVARQYLKVNDRELRDYINSLVKKGVLPQELKADFDPLEEKIFSFRNFIDQINNK